MRLFGLFVGGIFAIILIGSSTSELDNPDKDKLLIEVITYVMQKGHYDPKEIDDNFSESVFESYIQGIDGQHRFFLQSDINNFKRYKMDRKLKKNKKKKTSSYTCNRSGYSR